MINIVNGAILLENIQYASSNNTQIILFSEIFPKELFRNIDNMKTGYAWYYIWRSIVNREEVIFEMELHKII